jgi:hypothetical protein
VGVGELEGVFFTGRKKTRYRTVQKPLYQKEKLNISITPRANELIFLPKILCKKSERYVSSFSKTYLVPNLKIFSQAYIK